jgi:raffinose/stachyose/melibiose transport system substrate-binding protein
MKRPVSSRAISLVLGMAFAVTSIGLSGCGAQETTSSSSEATQTTQETAKASGEPVTLQVGLLAEDLDFFQQKITEDSFKKQLPNVTVDFQQYKDTEEMIKNQKIRQSANELPDVIYMKPDRILELKNSLLPWGKDEELVKQNKFVDTLDNNKAENGGYYGLPMKIFSEWVFYKKSVFKELNLQVPKTWNDFINTAKAIKANGKYIPIAMGGKDSWPCYPFNEFMPLLVGNNPKLLTDIAKQDEPFGTGSAFDTAYGMADQLYKADVMGKAMGTSWSEAEQMMSSNKAAMLAAGQYFLPDYKKNGGDMNDIDVFPLPVVNNSNEKIKSITMIDLFFAVSKNSKNAETAKKYISWFFSPDVYKSYITDRNMSSTINGVEADSIFAAAQKNLNVELQIYVPGDDNYTKLLGETKLDVKAIGTAMMAGKDYKTILADYNKKWKAAREKLGIK